MKSTKDIEINVSGDEFILVEAENLSLNDKFMQWKPKTVIQEITKKLITEAICTGVKNFYRPKCDPSFSDDGKSICFVTGKRPAVGYKSFEWWVNVAKDYNPERNSRLGTRLEYGAFLGVLMKKLVKEGKSVKWVWNSVCDVSHKLGHFSSSKNVKHFYELTGSRCICGFYDLGNTSKILADRIENHAFLLAGGSYDNAFYCYLPLLHFSWNLCDSVGWIVLEK